MGNMTGCHDVVPISNARDRFGLGSARDRVMLANLVAVSHD